jgi:hypothetical protein
MARVHFVGGEKGGVGKSFTARLLAQYFIDTKLPLKVFDTDASHATLTRFYSDFATEVSVADYDSLDQILIAAEEEPGAELVVDLAAQTAAGLDAWIEESDLFSLSDDINAQLVYWHVMDDGADAARLLERHLQHYAGKPWQLVVVKNLGRGNNFSFFEQSDIAQTARDAGAVFVDIPALTAGLTQKIDFYNFSFWAACQNTKAMSAIERQRVRVWLNKCYSQISALLKVS